MSKKDYQNLAAEFAALKELPTDEDYREAAEEMRCCLARRMASVLQADNPNFDRTRFLKACGVDE